MRATPNLIAVCAWSQASERNLRFSAERAASSAPLSGVAQTPDAVAIEAQGQNTCTSTPPIPHLEWTSVRWANACRNALNDEFVRRSENCVLHRSSSA